MSSPVSSTDTLRTADVLAQRLFSAGVRHAFGMPGGEVLTLVDALTKSGISFNLVKHENAGGFMAEGVYHRTGAPAVLVATVGPGALNAINVVENARQDRVPMVVITGAVDADEAATYTHQVLDQPAVFRAVSKASYTMAAGAAHVIADKAVSHATELRQGPVHIDLPIGVADAVVPAQPNMPAAQGAYLARGASGPEMETARAWLRTAQRPVAIAGLDVLAEPGAAEAVAEFCKSHNVPLITSYKAKGVLPEDHPLALGGAGLSPLADKHLFPVVEQADLILCLGYDPIEMRTGWRAPWDPTQQNVLDIAAEPNRHYMHQATLNVVADLVPTLASLSRDLTPVATWANRAVAAVKQALASAFPSDTPWGPDAVIATCREVLPPETLATVDSGAHRILLSQMWTCPEPRSLVQSSGLCTMGCALPLALGLSIAEPDRPVVGFMGDAGFLMVAGELATAAERNLRTIFVVFVDDSLALIEKKQRERQLTNAGVDFAPHDYAAMARAFGGNGHRVQDRDGLRAALAEALTAETFTLIAAEIPRGAYDGRI